MISTANKILDSIVSIEIPKFHLHDENIPGQSVFPMSEPATAAIESPTPTDSTPLYSDSFPTGTMERRGWSNGKRERERKGRELVLQCFTGIHL